MPFPKAVRDYDAVEFVGRKLLDDNWALTASYVWSRLYGNYSGLSESDENGRTEPNIGATFDSAVGLYDGEGRALYGRLATDRPHQAKAQFIYTAPFGIDVGVFQSLASGLPVSRSAVLTPGVVAFYAGRGSDGRTPAVSQTDLNVQVLDQAWWTQRPATDAWPQRPQRFQPGTRSVAVEFRNRPGGSGRRQRG